MNDLEQARNFPGSASDSEWRNVYVPQGIDLFTVFSTFDKEHLAKFIDTARKSASKLVAEPVRVARQRSIIAKQIG